MQFDGKAFRYGRDIDTDVIIPARYLTTGDPEVLGQHCMEDLDQSFVKRVAHGDVIVADENFGCGSSREHAPLAILGAGVSCVIAKSFARIFFRNAINAGLPIFESEEAVNDIKMGDEVFVDTETGTIKNKTSGNEFHVKPLPDFIVGIIDAGGLINYTRKRLEKLEN